MLCRMWDLLESGIKPVSPAPAERFFTPEPPEKPVWSLKRLPTVRETRLQAFWVGEILWRRKWHPTPVVLPGKSRGRRSPVGYSPWGHKGSDTTERLHFTSSPVQRTLPLAPNHLPKALPSSITFGIWFQHKNWWGTQTFRL